jgi:hypothetical protein
MIFAFMFIDGRKASKTTRLYTYVNEKMQEIGYAY